MTPTKPDIRDLAVEDTENGVTVTFGLDEGLEDTETSSLWVRARIRGSRYFQPVDLNILSGGKTASFVVEPGRVQEDHSIDLHFYLEAYPEREKSEVVERTISFEPDWFGLSKFEHDLRGLFERRTVEGQAAEAARFRLVSAEEAQDYKECALDNTVGLWMVQRDADDVAEPGAVPEYLGIAPEQPSFGIAWRAAWFPQVLARSREIRTENGWDDGRNH